MFRSIRKWLLKSRTKSDPILHSTANPKELDLIELQRAANVAWAHNRKEAALAYYEELVERDPRTNWHCLRCDHNEFQQSSIRVSGGAFAAWLEFDNNKFHTLTCRRCGFTGMYKVLMSAAEQGMDILIS